MKPERSLNPTFLSAFLMVFLLISTPARADFTFIRVVGSAFSTTEKTVFNPAETPFVYTRLPASGNALVNTFWIGPSGTLNLVQNFSNGDERWLSPANWNAISSEGSWTVNANYFFPGGASGADAVNFTVTPEPVSVALFLTGGLPMAWGLYRRRKLAHS